MTVEKAAPRVHMSVSSLHRKLRGERHITFTEIVYIAVLTGRDPTSFMRDLADPPTPCT